MKTKEIIFTIIITLLVFAVIQASQKKAWDSDAQLVNTLLLEGYNDKEIGEILLLPRTPHGCDSLWLYVDSNGRAAVICCTNKVLFNYNGAGK